MATNRRRVLLLAAVLAVLTVVMGYRVASVYQERQRLAALEEKARKLRQEVDADHELADRLARPDADLLVYKGLPRPVSAWRTAEMAYYGDLLAQQGADVLVVPFQVQEHAFSRQIRSLMTAQLASAVSAAAAAGTSIPDPYLVARALGEGQRSYDLTDIFSLANRLKAKRVVAAYVGHDGKGGMRLTLHYYDRGTNEFFGDAYAPRRGRYSPMVASPLLKSRHFEKLVHNDSETPIDVCQRLMPEMLAFLGLHAAAGAVPEGGRGMDGAPLPESPKGMFAGDRQPARDAYYFSLLAALTPLGAERTRERFEEKAMLSVLAMSPGSPDYRALRARGLMQIGMRKAALEALGTPQTADERHLAALLQGNLPGVRAAHAAIPGDVRGLIAALEENALAAVYGGQTSKTSLSRLPALKLPGDAWPLLAARAMTDWDSWTLHENLLLKALLDQEFPIAGYSAQSMLQGASAMGDVSKLQANVDLSVLEHVRRQFAQICCQPLAPRPRAQDYLDLLEGIAADNLARRAAFMAHLQGRPDEALQYFMRIGPTYRDHPQLALVRAEAQLDLSRSAQGSEHDALLRSAYTDALNVFFWEQTQSRAASEAFGVLASSAQRDTRYPTSNVYLNDYPFRPFYRSGLQGFGTPERILATARRALDNATSEFHTFQHLAWVLQERVKSPQELDRLLESLDRRFVGHPGRVSALAQASRRKGDLQGAEARYREGIRDNPDEQRLYRELGELLFDQAMVERSAAAFMSYPALRDRARANPVGTANYAYEAGSRFYWSGDLKRAFPLYQVAAQLRTGSNSSLASQTRLQLSAGDFAGALESTLERATRYDSEHAYRDYFGMLHAMGRSQEAWQGFAAVLPRDQPQPWETALVGHRRENATEAKIAAWLSREPMKSAGTAWPYAAMYLVRAALTDRTPSDELPALLLAIDRPVWQWEYAAGFKGAVVTREAQAGLEYLVLGPESASTSWTPKVWFQEPSARKSRVKSEYVYLVEAYTKLKRGDFPAARALFQEAAGLYNLRSLHLSYLLPYYAYAAARSGATSEVEGLLGRFDKLNWNFDYHLARAILDGAAGRHAEASEHLRLARYQRPHTEFRAVPTEYQYAEVCEWLYESTRQPQYRDTALEWARTYQRLQPWHAWAYAIEAKLSPDVRARRRAIAMAHYLDPGSERISRLAPSEVRAALKEFAGRNPFLRKEPAKPQEEA